MENEEKSKIKSFTDLYTERVSGIRYLVFGIKKYKIQNTKYKIQKAAIIVVIFVLSLFVFTSDVLAVTTISRPQNNLGMVGYWNFNTGKGGRIAFDMSGNGNNGTLTSMDPATDWVDGKSGNGTALDFDEVNDRVVIPDFSYGPSFTVSFWYKLTDNAGSFFQYMYSHGTVSVANSLNVYCIEASNATDAGHLRTVILNNAGQPAAADDLDITEAFNPCDTNWHFYTVTVTTNDIKVYLDGTQYNTATSGGGTFNPATSLFLGSREDLNADRFYGGRLDEVRTQNRVLSVDEIKRLYNLTAPKVGAVPISNGLLGYWDFEVGKKGAIAFDRSGNNYSGTLTSMDPATDWVDGKSGNGTALDFDGSDDRVNMGNVLDFERTNSFTMSAWIKLPSATPSTPDQIISKTNGSAVGYSFTLRGDQANDPIELELRGSGVFLNTVFNQTWTTNWTHLVWTYDGSNTVAGMKLYRDGAIQTVTSSISNLNQNITNTGNFLIGAFTTSSNPFLGQMDEVRVYNRALSADEIKRLYNLTKPEIATVAISNGLVGYWDFNSGKGTRYAFDSSSNKNDGVLTNMDPATDWIDSKNSKLGQTLSFDGGDDSFRTSSTTNLNVTGNLTMSFWLYVRNAPSDWAYVIAKRDGTSGNDTYTAELHPNNAGTNRMYHWFTRAGGNYIGYASSDSYRFRLNTWDHWVIIRDTANSTVKMYRNGEDAGAALVSGTWGAIDTTTANLAIGGASFDTAHGVNGDIDDVRIYNRVLSLDEIKRLYLMGL